MKTFNITVSETYNKALTYIAEDQLEWINNAIQERCRRAVDEIVSIALEKSLEEGVQLPTTKEGIVDLAFEKKWIKSVIESNAEYFELNTPRE